MNLDTIAKKIDQYVELNKNELIAFFHDIFQMIQPTQI